MQEEKSSLKSSWRSRILGKAAKLLYTTAPWLAILMNTVSAEGTGIRELTNNIASAVEALGGLMVAVAVALLAVGGIIKLLPGVSQRTKELGGQILDHAFILGALAAVGAYLLAFAGQIAVGIVGQGEAPSFSGPWKLSS